MEKNLIPEELKRLLEAEEFVHLATCDNDGQPFVIAKFLIKVDADTVYLADYVMGRVFENLKKNPNVSLSFVDLETLQKYQLAGRAQVLDKGKEFDSVLKNLEKRKMHFCVERIVEGSRKGVKHKSFEITFPEQLIVLKVKVDKTLCVSSQGEIEK